MLGDSRFRYGYPLILLVVAAAAAVLAYYAWLTAVKFAQLGDETIAQTTLLVVNQKVSHIEQKLIASDNVTFEQLELLTGDTLESDATLGERTPTLQAALIIDDSGHVDGCYFRGAPSERRRFLKLFLEQVLYDLELERQRRGQLRHLHRSYNGSSYLFSYKATLQDSRRRYLVLYHSTARILDEHFESLFAKEEGKQLYNVVDNLGRRVFGRDLAGAGDYLVGRRFPTTLYEWRLQVAPKLAPRLKAEGRSRQVNEVALIVIAFITVLAGMGIVVFASAKERHLNSLKAEFIANVSHELKTPLSVIRMFGELLTRHQDIEEERQRRYLSIICRESDRLTGLIENVLDFSALERGKQSYDFHATSVTEVLKRAIDTFLYRADRDDVTVNLVTPEDNVVAHVDEHAVLLATVNLLDNAAKYGAAPISLELRSDAHELVISVRDQGPGIPQEHLTRIFERFFRAKGNRGVRGSGIGLALVREIAIAHGGSAFARNHEDGGAQVGFTLPPVPATHTS